MFHSPRIICNNGNSQNVVIQWWCLFPLKVTVLFSSGNITNFLCVSLHGPNFSNVFKPLKAGGRFSLTDVLLYLITTYDELAKW